MSSAGGNPIRVGLLGLGTVGGGVVEILHRHRRLIAERSGVDLTVVRAAVRSPRKKRTGAATDVPLTTDPAAILDAPDVDVVAELMGGIEPARAHILRALAQGKPVVTANKAVLAAHRTEIFRAAAKARSDVFFEAAVCGGIPIIRTLREGLASDRITELVGILNGTTNYILEAMRAGADYASALKDAQGLGFAEADPTLDVGGHDAADKLAILTHLAFGTVVSPDRIATEGITALTPDVLADAERLGYRVKLLGIARRAEGGLELRVHPTFIPAEHALASVPGAYNAVAVQSDALGTTLYQGAGAGALPTGSSVVADLIEAGRNLRAGLSGRVLATQTAGAPRVMSADKARSAYYVRLLVREQPGVLAAVTRIFAQNKVSLATVLQRERGAEPHPVPVVITTHRAPAGAMGRALRAIGKLEALQAPPHLVPIEELK
jgi:homoserine dehydrogenase